MKTKWLFSYFGAIQYYWLMATDYTDFMRQIDEKGMEIPDWWEDTKIKESI